MQIKKLFNDAEEHLDYAWSIMDFDTKVWREEDLEILNPFFVYADKFRHERTMNEEERRGFEHYNKCCKEYANDKFEIRDAISAFSLEDLAEFFLLEPPIMSCWDTDDDGNNIDEDGNIIPPTDRDNIKINTELNIQYPIVFLGWIDSGWDRMGDYKVSVSDYVELREFKKE